ncbi:pyridoxal phosphate-dependent transferase [Triangularia setosa]|uniref:Pyridoxal phosphate-dependent transferase n=1 Tax=Triangularia setosa TaxID=2587417 RepID=A0AAN6W5Y3_9PEZI|nr:pyridoxal phosphate-dependent transferase [Podospora setosa]
MDSEAALNQTLFDIHKIAIIGAGPCGLAAAKYLVAQNVFKKIDIFEQQSEVGGVWKYSAKPSENHRVPQVSPECPPDLPLKPGDGNDDKGPVFPSPMYELLHTNIPRGLMPFTDFPFRDDLLIFPSRDDVQTYLVQYSRDIRHLISFSTEVKNVRSRQNAEGKDQWDVDVLSLQTGELTSATYDAVVVASGHYSIIYIPDIKAISEFNRTYPEVISHSKYYRTPEPFRNKKVIVVGNAASGLDIASQISQVSQQPLLLSVRTPTPEANLEWTGAEEVPEIEEFLVVDKAVRFKDGRVEKDIDAIVFATGYLYSFPFLTSLQPPLVTDGRRVRGLYKHLFHIDHPTLVFPGLPIKVVPFPVSQSQAAIFSRVWANLLPLPSVDEMKRWEDKESKEKGSKYHVWPVGADSDWITKSETPGKEPPRWSEELCWQRTIHMKAKLRFELQGRKAKSLKELGFATMASLVYRDGSRQGAGGLSDDDDKPLPLNFTHLYSEITKHRNASKIKAIYKFFQIPGILNIAGGLPNAQFFPYDTLEAQAAKPERWSPSSGSSNPSAANHITIPHDDSTQKDLLQKIDLATALQYGMAQGYPPLLSWIRQFTREHLHPDAPYKGGPEVILTCGSTDGFAKALNLFVTPWRDTDPIEERPGMLCETYVYTNIPNQATPQGVQMVPVETDKAGMAVSGPGGLEDVLANWDSTKGKRPHLLYTVTLGHNPTGILLSVERKRAIYAICSKYDVIIIEDEPYWYLQFPDAASEEAKSRGLPPPNSPPVTTATNRPSSGFPFLDSLTPSFTPLDIDGRVVRLDTFSKTVAPGCRLGWITAQPSLIERFERITEATTQQPSGFVQSLISKLLIAPPVSPAPSSTSTFSLFQSKPSPQPAGWQASGFVTWLSGLRSSYQSRMVKMCTILDSGSDLITTPPTRSQSWAVVKKTKLYSFDWPRAGMFIWLRMYFASHPLFPVFKSALSTALMVWLTGPEYKVLVTTGAIFAANDEIKQREAWEYFRLCFAAEEEKNIELAAESFVEGVKGFWEVRDPEVVKKLLEEVKSSEARQQGEMVNLAGFMGC